ncbi:MAG: hypothetical protein R6V50_07380 [Thermoplasmatota archaeon]
MHPFYREFELVKPVSDFFIKKGYTIFREIRIGFCRADIVAIKDNLVTAIELKLSDRKKAVIQAKNYQYGADFVYLAFPLLKIHAILRTSEHLLKKEGIGLLSIHEEECSVTEIIKAKRSAKKFASLTINEITQKKNHSHSKKRRY